MLQSPFGADPNEGSSPTQQNPGYCSDHTHWTLTMGQALNLQLWTSALLILSRDSVPQLFCLLVTRWLPIAVSVRTIPGPSRRQKEIRKECFFPSTGCKSFLLVWLGEVNLVSSLKQCRCQGRAMVSLVYTAQDTSLELETMWTSNLYPQDFNLEWWQKRG